MRIRPACIHDDLLLLEWRNDPLTRSMSKNTDIVTLEQHRRWLAERLQRPEPDLYIATEGDIAIGTYRLDADEISYTIAPQWRAKGYGYKMLREAVQRHGPRRAEIYRRNVASIRVASAAGLTVHILD